jgi:hypothetical protein
LIETSKLRELLSDAVFPTIEHLLPEFTGLSVTLVPGERYGIDGPHAVLTVSAGGEELFFYLWRADFDETVADCAARLFSDLQDWISETRFGWGQLRT